jgi:hypothetical protein
VLERPIRGPEKGEGGPLPLPPPLPSAERELGKTPRGKVPSPSEKPFKRRKIPSPRAKPPTKRKKIPSPRENLFKEGKIPSPKQKPFVSERKHLTQGKKSSLGHLKTEKTQKPHRSRIKTIQIKGKPHQKKNPFVKKISPSSNSTSTSILVLPRR